MKKGIIVSVVCMFVLVAMIATPALAKDPEDGKSNGVPFEELWEAIEQLRTDITAFVGQAIEDALSSLSISWGQITGIPGDIADGDQVGITSEDDPIYGASAASGITSDDVTNWNAAYGWGDHSQEGYLTSYTETDPFLPENLKDGVDWNEISNIPAGFADNIDNVGSGAGDGHSLDAHDGSPVDAVYVDDNGNVGIGTDTPGEYKLNVKGGWDEGIRSEGHQYGLVAMGNPFVNDSEGVVARGTKNGVRAEGALYAVHGYSWAAVGVGVYGSGPNYDFYAGGDGTNYGPFTGGHEVKLADGFPEEIKPGTIVSVTGETRIRLNEEGDISLSSTLPTVRLADNPDDSRVFGVLVAESPLPDDHWYTDEADDSDRFGVVNALGEGRVWVTDINGDIEAGDYITTSAIAGYGQKQDDDLLHSYTLGKAIESVDWSSVTETVEHNGQAYKAYLIAVVYTSG